MLNKTFENIIIIVLIITIVYILFRKEYMDGEINNIVSNEQNFISQESPQELLPIMKQKGIITELVEEVMEDKTIDDNRYSTEKDLEEVNKFIDEYKDYGRFDKLNKKIENVVSDKDVNAYRKSFLDFRNYVNNDSHGFDAVDKVNLETLSKLQSQGLKVSDVYDRVTANNFNSSNIDIVGMQHNHIQDDVVLPNEFHYDSDSVNNGAFFFKKVRGYDNINYNKAL